MTATTLTRAARRLRLSLELLLIFIVGVLAAPTTPTTTAQAPANVSFPYKAVAVLTPTANGTASGTLAISQSADLQTVRIDIRLYRLAPASVHGVHFYSFGDISDAETGASLGGHLNPTKRPHGCPDPTLPASLAAFHAGDVGNVTADDDGSVVLTVVRPVTAGTASASLVPGAIGLVVGRGVVVRSGRDDCVTQPTGDSGSRITIGVVGWQNGTAFPPAAAAEADPESPASPNSTAQVRSAKAVAVLAPLLANGTATAVAALSQHNASSPVKIKIAAVGLDPGSTYAVHVREFGDITDRSPRLLTAGGLFNPSNTAPSACPPLHRRTATVSVSLAAGVLGTLRADATGGATLAVQTMLLSLYAADTVRGVVGRAIAVVAAPGCVSDVGDAVAVGVVGVRSKAAADAAAAAGATGIGRRRRRRGVRRGRRGLRD
ncbi:Copper/zinc superoxide dismutase-domain-containing protein [Zopfochytrium polystomum]|nr:Copper/zinc superoxide dismutase-domain-containing protein [Zopfochytrium polystomum]